MYIMDAFCVSGLHKSNIFVVWMCDDMMEVHCMMKVVANSQSCYVSCRWAWVLQDALGIAFCLYMLKTVRLPTFKVAQHYFRSEKCFSFKVLLS